MAVAAALERYALVDQARAELRTLSGGTKQRAYIAMSSIHKPSVLLLDEPSVGLDLTQRTGLREAIRNAGNDSIVVVTSHDVDDLVDMADRLVVLAAGRVVFAGSVSELTASRDRALVERRLRELMTGEVAS